MLRRADARDVDRVTAFELIVEDRKLFGPPLDAAAVLIEIETNAYFVEMQDGQIIATGAYRVRPDDTAYLSNIAVHPAHRRSGHARALMQHLLASCRSAPTVDLAVHPDNLAALALYRSFGFAPTRRQDDVFGDGEPRLIMVRAAPIT
jgi:[ribosomal protein S18]-alanine N-acetyltransferase